MSGIESGSAPALGATHAAIQLDRVRKAFGDFVAVREADFAIAAGELFALLGPSGCGKTTTLRMIAGFEAPTSGRVLLDGQDQSGIPPHKRNVNTVFQQYALFPHMTVAENVAFGPRNRGERGASLDRKVNDMLEVVRMGDFAKRKPAQLSGGQQQRVALARALVNRPSALLLDEPLAALDLKLRQAMQVELKRIQREVGITFVFVTHDQQEALALSDRIAVMSEGRVEQIGSPQQIYREPSTLFVAGFIGSANLLPGTAVGVEGDVVATRLACGGCVVESKLRDGHEIRLGEPAAVMLRPEDVRLVSPSEHPGVALRVRVRDISFHGSTVRVGLVCEDVPLCASVPASVAGDLRPGDERLLTWADGAARILSGTPLRAGATDADPDAVEASL